MTRRSDSSGFTILEVILFLAISGVLLVALIAGVNVNINQERYKDSVNNFVASLQKQYVLATNITNARSAKWSCGNDLQPDTSADTARGTTECNIIGRLVTGDAEGGKITVSNVVAYNINEENLASATSDIDALTNDMTLAALSQTESTNPDDWQEIELGWGSTIKTVSGGVPKNGEFTMAILRSPLTGNVATYMSDQATDDWGAIVTPDNATRGLALCVTTPALIAIPNFAVTIAGASVSTAGVARATGVAGC